MAGWAERLPGPADAFGLGLVLVLLGVFLLANSVLLQDPRLLVAEHFGAPRARLVSVRRAIFLRLQVHLGFLLVLSGVALAVYGHYGRVDAEGEGHRFPLAWAGLLGGAVVALELGGWWLSHALFLRYVRQHFRTHPPALETDLALARELGELFGIRSDGNDSVPTYLARIRDHLGLATPAPQPRSRSTLE
jgi:hypothetical protein